VYAAGDVTGSHQHTPAAWYEGQLAAENALLGNRRAADFSVFPTATFTIPALAQVGITEATARQRGGRVVVGRAPFTDSTAASVRAETEGLVKTVFDEPTGRLLGVHVLGPGAEDLIHVAAVAMRAGLARDDLAGMHYVFPTLAGSVFDAMWP
jgi:pyruvate/2-oxoglutarate dehydrogenase complex dihydrolipoamide dehydrogenase (E3) component